MDLEEDDGSSGLGLLFGLWLILGSRSVGFLDVGAEYTRFSEARDEVVAGWLFEEGDGK